MVPPNRSRGAPLVEGLVVAKVAGVGLSGLALDELKSGVVAAQAVCELKVLDGIELLRRKEPFEAHH